MWTAIALHTTPGIPEFLHAEAALLHVGAGMDVAGRSYDQFTDEEREAVVAAYPRERLQTRHHRYFLRGLEGSSCHDLWHVQ